MSMIYVILFVSYFGVEEPLVRFIEQSSCDTAVLSLKYKEPHFNYYCKVITKKEILKSKNPMELLSLTYCDGGQWCQF
jgi:hypothetical protein